MQVLGAVYNEYRKMLVVQGYEKKVHQEQLVDQVYKVLELSDDQRLYWDDFKQLFSELLDKEIPDASMVRLLDKAVSMC
jgi:hypothetical protein